MSCAKSRWTEATLRENSRVPYYFEISGASWSRVQEQLHAIEDAQPHNGRKRKEDSRGRSTHAKKR
eukprot:49416-Eustigmatos_ZCMA.PRE.1